MSATRSKSSESAESSLTPPRAPRVFISYSHDSELHRSRVLKLAQRLREDGVEAWIDQFENPPNEGWPRWMQKQLTTACFVLLVCTETYRRRFEGELAHGTGRGSNWEGFLTQQLLYEDDARNLRYVPVLLDGSKAQDVPLVLRATSYYQLPDHYWELYRRLTDQLAVAPVAVGSKKALGSAGAAEDRELLALRDEKKRVVLAGGDTTELDERILMRRRQLRDSDDLGQGTRLSDRFELSESVGSGGFGTVWRAYDHRCERVVAVKVLHRQYADDRTQRERFYRGARRMASLRHPHVVRVFDECGYDGKATYFVMDYVAGGDLRKRVCSGAWRQELILPTLLGVAEALKHAHAHHFVHRDVKPSNVLLNENDAPLLTDFDLVHAADTTGGTRTGAGYGTFPYAAPEAMEDASQVDGRADVFSLSMVGIFLLLGKELPRQAFVDPGAFIRGLNAPRSLKQLLTSTT